MGARFARSFLIRGCIVVKDYVFSFLNQFWRVLSGPITLFLLPIYLSLESQGYWYVFLSLAGLLVFAELGVAGIISIFASHEFSNLQFDEQKRIVGAFSEIANISSLFLFFLRWVRLSVLIAVPVVFAIGCFVLCSGDKGFWILLPWGLFLLSAVLTMCNGLFLCFVEGCGEVAEGQQIRMVSSLMGLLLLVASLVSGCGVYSLVFSWLLSGFFHSFLILKKYRFLIEQIGSQCLLDLNSWWAGFLPLIFRTGMSFVGGYLSFQTMTPVIFKYYGAGLAGKFGLSMALFFAIHSISLVWMTAFMPKLAGCFARREYERVNAFFLRLLPLVLLTYLVGVGVFFLIEKNLYVLFDISSRLVDFNFMLLLAAAFFFQTLVAILAGYVRAQKKEPFHFVSLVFGVYVLVGSVIVAKNFPFEYMSFVLVSAYVFVLPVFLLLTLRELKL